MKFGHIKNPLTVIALFAAVTEVGGTVVLPHVEDLSNQRLYIWFLMLFPTFLVTLFFGTLWKAHTKLYAPSDFADEKHFVAAAGPAIREKLEQEVVEATIEGGGHSQQVENDVEAEDVAATSDQDSNSGVDASISSATTEATTSQETGAALRETGVNYFLAEELVMNKLAGRYGPSMKRRVSPQGHRNIVFDGVIRNDEGMTVVEVKYTRTGRMSPSFVQAMRSAHSYYSTLSPERQAEFRLLMIIVCDKVPRSLRPQLVEKIMEAARIFPFRVTVQLEELERLTAGTVFD